MAVKLLHILIKQSVTALLESIHVSVLNLIPYMGKFWSGKKLANLANRRPFANLLYMQLICQYFALQLIQISAFANVLPRQNFPRTVFVELILLSLGLLFGD